MTHPSSTNRSRDEQFYARALAILVGPSRRMAWLLRLCNLVYWAAVIAALAWLLSQALDREPPVLIRSATLLSPSVAAGEPVRVAYDLARRRTCETDVSWSVYDGAGRDPSVRTGACCGALACPGRGSLRPCLAHAQQRCPGSRPPARRAGLLVPGQLPAGRLPGRRLCCRILPSRSRRRTDGRTSEGWCSSRRRDFDRGSARRDRRFAPARGIDDVAVPGQARLPRVLAGECRSARRANPRPGVGG